MSARAPVGKQSDEWETPQWLFDALNAEFGFTRDGAATDGNAKCKLYNTAADNTGSSWDRNRVFCNPPYSNIGEFVSEALQLRSLVVLLLPVRTDSDWFRSLIESGRVTIRFFRKRIAFVILLLPNRPDHQLDSPLRDQHVPSLELHHPLL